MNFTITNVSDKDVSLALVSGLVDIGTVDLPDKIKAGQSARGEIVLNPDVLDDEFEKSFTFAVGEEVKTRFTVPVKRSIKKPTVTAGSKDQSSGK